MIVTRLKTVDLDVERLEVQSPQNQNKDKFKNLTKTNINVNTELQKEEIYMNENENNYSLILVVRGDTSSSTSQIDRTIAKKKTKFIASGKYKCVGTNYNGKSKHIRRITEGLVA